MTVIECRVRLSLSRSQKSVRKFNSRLADLYQNKLKVDSAINEELLKMLRARQLCYKRALLDKKEQNYMSMIGEKEGIIENLQDDIQKLQKLSSECRGAYESQVNRDKSLEKNFKKDFPDMPALVLEQLSKMYKKRPKIHQRIQTSVALVSELSRCSVSGEKPIFLLAECLDYLKGLDNLDSFSNASPNTSEEIWAILCRVRRLKVESELKMKALSLEVTEADATVNVFQKKMIKNKEMLTSLQGELRVVRNEKLNLIHNLQIQLVMKQGLVEISIQGSISDFDDAILINRVCVDRMNETIKKAGQRKLRTMHETTNFRRGILCKEWEHKKLRMEIEDLKEHLHTLEGIKVTKDIQMYLRRQAQGLPQDKTTSLEKELQLLREVRMKPYEKSHGSSPGMPLSNSMQLLSFALSFSGVDVWSGLGVGVARAKGVGVRSGLGVAVAGTKGVGVESGRKGYKGVGIEVQGAREQEMRFGIGRGAVLDGSSTEREEPDATDSVKVALAGASA
uniref:Uncharacterized protein n=1 Tax=Timema tahoe TaxID=61484 RepID=A0A7R9P0F4_9NEOP|nr:unnamed protein product [Timema tahoe]